MRTHRKLMALAGAALLLASGAQAQYAILHNFTGGTTDGAAPVNSLARDGSTLYGMTSVGVNSATGMLFRINTDSSGYVILTNGIGFSSLHGSLQVSGTFLYGVNARESFLPPVPPQLFRINTGGTGFTNLYDFGLSLPPVDTLTLVGSVFYGFSVTATNFSDTATLFRLNSNGTGYSNLYTFGPNSPTDGSVPVGSPLVSSGVLYGMCSAGGLSGAGTIFKVNTNGTGYTVLHNFSADDGAPFGSLKLSGSTLYGVTASTGPTANRIFRINTDGSTYTILAIFPQAGSVDEVSRLTGNLPILGTTFYGMTFQSGGVGTDTVFSVSTSGDGFSVLHPFTGPTTDGSTPVGSPVLSSSTLFGLTAGGGSASLGTIFSSPLSNATNVPSVCLPSTQPAKQPLNITRNSSFWFTHSTTNDPTCVTLERAIIANGGTLNVGFLCMPVTYENSDNSLDSADTLIEALGLYYRNAGFTGEGGGSQNQQLPASRLCRARKKLSRELIAAIANNVLLGTTPDSAGFPPDLIEIAGQVAAGNDPAAASQMTSVLKKFNNSGVTNDFPEGLFECSPNSRSSLRSFARDATTQLTCPGLNDNCATAEEVYFSFKNGFFTKAKFNRNVNTSDYPSGLVYWRVSPPMAAVNRSFRVTTDGSNYDTTLNVYTGDCALITSNGTTVVDATGLLLYATSTGSNLLTEISFTTDGLSTYFIEAGPAPTAFAGELKIRIASP